MRPDTEDHRTLALLQLVDPARQMRRGNGRVAEEHKLRMRAGVLHRGRVGLVVSRPHDLDTQCAWATVELFDTHKDPHCLRLQQDAFGHTFGQRFQKVQTFRRKLVGNRLGHAVIGQDAIHIIINRTGQRLDLDHDIEAHALRGAAFGLKRPDLDLNDMIAQRNTVERAARGGRLGPFGGMRKGKADFGTHGHGPLVGRQFARTIGARATLYRFAHALSGAKTVLAGLTAFRPVRP